MGESGIGRVQVMQMPPFSVAWHPTAFETATEAEHVGRAHCQVMKAVIRPPSMHGLEIQDPCWDEPRARRADAVGSSGESEAVFYCNRVDIQRCT